MQHLSLELVQRDVAAKCLDRFAHADRDGMRCADRRFQAGSALVIREDPVVCDRIVDQAKRRSAKLCHGEDHTKNGKPMGKVPGAIHRVDDKGQRRARDLVKQCRIDRSGLFAHNKRMGKGKEQGARYHRLGGGVGCGDQIIRPGFGRYIHSRQTTEPRHDLCLCGAADDVQDVVLLGLADRKRRCGRKGI